MQNRVSYATVGLFVVLLGAALVGAGLWFGGDLRDDDRAHYLVYPEEAMTGLSTTSAVRYQGIRVGGVEEIGLDEMGRVRILIGVERRTPVRADTQVRLGTQGLTGMGHLELVPGEDDAPQPEARGALPYPVLDNAPSLRHRLETAVEEGLSSLDRLGRQVEELLADENLETLIATMDHLETITGTLADNTDTIVATLDNTERLTANAAQVAEDAPLLMARVERTLDDFDTMVGVVSASADEVRLAGVKGGETMDRMSRETLPQVNALLLEAQRLSEGLTRLTEELGEQPSRLLFGAPRRVPGPGEED